VGNLIVTDVMSENEVMRRLLVNTLLRVKITEPEGTPVNYQSTFLHGSPRKVHGRDHWGLQFDENDPAHTLPLNNLVRAMEVWLGDTILHRFKHNLGTYHSYLIQEIGM